MKPNLYQFLNISFQGTTLNVISLTQTIIPGLTKSPPGYKEKNFCNIGTQYLMSMLPTNFLNTQVQSATQPQAPFAR